MTVATEREIQNYYSGQAVASNYVGSRFVSEVQRLLHDRQVAAIQGLIEEQHPERILEIAPGPGRLTKSIRPNGQLICLEYNEGMIEVGRRACSSGKHSWVRGNGFHLPFGQVFDLVYTFRFIRHFHQTDRVRLYEQLFRVLKPGGWLLFDAVNASVSRPLRESRPEEYPVYDVLYEEPELCAELKAAGFGQVKLVPVQKRIRLQGLCQSYLGPRINPLNRAIIRLLEAFPKREGLEWIVTCRRG